MASITPKQLTILSLPEDTFPNILSYLSLDDLNSLRHTNSFLRKKVHEDFAPRWFVPGTIEALLSNNFFKLASIDIPKKICSNVVRLFFSGGNVPSQYILKHFPHLESISSESGLINNHDVELFVKNLPRLTHLDISKSFVSNSLFEVFQQKTAAKLTSLSFQENRRISSDGIATLVAHVPSLTQLSLFPLNEFLINDATVTAITTHAQQLRFLCLTHCSITNSALTKLGQSTLQLQDLWLNSCPSITDAGIEVLVRNSPSITRLNIACTKITEKALDAIQKYRAPSIKRLDISDCDNLTETSFYFWVIFSPKAKKHLSKCTALSELHMDGLKMEDADVDAITKKMKKLTLFSAKYNTLTEKAYSSLKANCPLLSTVDLR